MYCVGPIQKPRCSPLRPSRFDSVGMAGYTFAISRRGMKAAEGYIGGAEVKSASFLLARWRSGRRTRGRGGILRKPSHRIAVVLESFCAFERVLRGVHHEVVLVVVLGGDPDRIERYSDILLAHAEEPTYADDKRGDLAVTIDQYIHDLADLVVRGVIDVLFVPVGDRHAA